MTVNGYARKAWEIIGYTFQGDAYCPGCAVDMGELETDVGNYSEDRPHPVFVSDSFGWEDDDGEQHPYSCGRCSAVIE
jgi:hypothetical protein